MTYEDYKNYMRNRYGPGPWGPENRMEEDSWENWCARVGVDPKTGHMPRTPAQEEADIILREVILKTYEDYKNYMMKGAGSVGQ